MNTNNTKDLIKAISKLYEVIELLDKTGMAQEADLANDLLDALSKTLSSALKDEA